MSKSAAEPSFLVLPVGLCGCDKVSYLKEVLSGRHWFEVRNIWFRMDVRLLDPAQHDEEMRQHRCLIFIDDNGGVEVELWDVPPYVANSEGWYRWQYRFKRKKPSDRDEIMTTVKLLLRKRKRQAIIKWHARMKRWRRKSRRKNAVQRCKVKKG